MKVRKSDLFIAREAEMNGHMVSMNNIVLPRRTELNNRLNLYFRNELPDYMGVFGEDEGLNILYSINEYMKMNKLDKMPLDYPLSSGTDTHLIPITDNLHVKVVVVDEYYGDGDYEQYVSIQHFMINEKSTEKDVDELIVFLKQYVLN